LPGVRGSQKRWNMIMILTVAVRMNMTIINNRLNMIWPCQSVIVEIFTADCLHYDSKLVHNLCTYVI
jgi:hypothetical protein